MSKTIPFYIDTKENAIVELIKHIDPSKVPGGGGIGPLVPGPAVIKAHKPFVGDIYSGQRVDAMVCTFIGIGDDPFTATPLLCDGMLQINKPNDGGTKIPSGTVIVVPAYFISQYITEECTTGMVLVTFDDITASAPQMTDVKDYTNYTLSEGNLFIQIPEMETNQYLFFYSAWE